MALSSTKDRKAGKRPGTLGRVLVVEDDPVLALAIEDALLHEGGAREVVIDVHLADRDDGWAIAELVDLLGPKPPRIVFSTGAPEDIPPQVAEMGPIFEKPYDPMELVKVLAGEERTGLFARLRGKR